MFSPVKRKYVISRSASSSPIGPYCPLNAFSSSRTIHELPIKRRVTASIQWDRQNKNGGLILIILWMLQFDKDGPSSCSLWGTTCAREAGRHVGDDVPYGGSEPPCGLGNDVRMAAARTRTRRSRVKMPGAGPEASAAKAAIFHRRESGDFTAANGCDFTAAKGCDFTAAAKTPPPPSGSRSRPRTYPL